MRQKMSPKTVRRITDVEAKALDLRKAGATYDEIAHALGLSNKMTAWRAIDRALMKTIKEPSNKLRRLELARLDALFLSLWQVASGGDLGAIDRILKLMERRSRLLGLDIPVPQIHRHTDGLGNPLAPAVVFLPHNERDQVDTPGGNGDDPEKATDAVDDRLAHR